MQPIRHFSARALVLPQDNVDTDQIIPARFLAVTGKDRLVEGLFAHWRDDDSFVLNHPNARGAEILIAGHNFGCGSSREHAVWALQSFGFRAVISTGFADIFRNNALANGLLPIELPPHPYQIILAAVRSDPAVLFEVDLSAQSVRVAGLGAAHFDVDPFAKECLLQGTDALGYLLSAEAAIAAYEAAHAR